MSVPGVSVSRLAAAFGRLRSNGGPGVIPYLMVGAPSLKATLELVPALVAGGADAVELGIPFSDPLADGVSIQRSGRLALENGVTVQTCLDLCRELRQQGLAVPLLFMSYYNPLVAYGLAPFAAGAAAAGADGLIVADLPPEEAEPLRAACQGEGLDLIFLVAPTSPPQRVARVAQEGSGFLYCVSLTGVTGAREQLSPGLAAFLQRVRQATALPIAVGFGISRREHVLALAPYAEAAIVGSALVDLLERTPAVERAERSRAFVAHLKGLEGGR